MEEAKKDIEGGKAEGHEKCITLGVLFGSTFFPLLLCFSPELHGTAGSTYTEARDFTNS
jgi:hypothetical protein